MGLVISCDALGSFYIKDTVDGTEEIKKRMVKEQVGNSTGHLSFERWPVSGAKKHLLFH
jgi:hypothetical protein